MKPRILVVEDVTLIAIDIADRLSTWGYEPIGPFDNGEEALKYLKHQGSTIDVAILDIEIKGEFDGVSLAQKLNQLYAAPVVFLTKKEDEQTLKRVLKIPQCAYLNKPFGNNELRLAIHNALEIADKKQVNEIRTRNEFNDRFFVKNGTGSYPIFIENIIYIQAEGDVSKLFLEDTEKPVVVSGNLGRIEEKLAYTECFERVSRFYIVNLKKIIRINSSSDETVSNKERNKKFLKLAGTSTIIPLSEKYRSAVFQRLDFL